MEIISFASYTPYGQVLLATNLQAFASRDAELRALVGSAAEAEGIAIWASHHLREASRQLMALSVGAVDVSDQEASDRFARHFAVPTADAKAAIREVEAFLMVTLSSAISIIDRVERIHQRFATIEPRFWRSINFDGVKKSPSDKIRTKLYAACDASPHVDAYEWGTAPSPHILDLYRWRSERMHQYHYTAFVRRSPVEVVFSTAWNAVELADGDKREFTLTEVLENLRHLDHFMEWWVEECEKEILPFVVPS